MRRLVHGVALRGACTLTPAQQLAAGSTSFQRCWSSQPQEEDDRRSFIGSGRGRALDVSKLPWANQRVNAPGSRAPPSAPSAHKRTPPRPSKPLPRFSQGSLWNNVQPPEERAPPTANDRHDSHGARGAAKGAPRGPQLDAHGRPARTNMRRDGAASTDNHHHNKFKESHGRAGARQSNISEEMIDDLEDVASSKQAERRALAAGKPKRGSTRFYEEIPEEERRKPLRKDIAAPATDSAIGRLLAAKASKAAKEAASGDQQEGSEPVSKRKEKKLRKQEQEQKASERREVVVSDLVTVVELARALGQEVDKVQAVLRDLGEETKSHDSPVSFDAAELAAGEFQMSVRRDPSHKGGQLAPRPAVVAVMGHVDHGKTTLLDKLRNASVAAGEAGGITQHIGAFVVHLPETGGHLTFLDTPGHAAFREMRARGARVTDLVVLVVAADDGVMQQTLEALQHATSAGVRIVVAITKCDKPGVDIMRVKTQLLEAELALEEFGGDVPLVEVSAMTGQGMAELQHALQLQAEDLDLQARVDCDAEGVVVESHKDVGMGALATVLVTRGKLSVGEAVVVGCNWGRVRSMRTPAKEAVTSANPAMPVVISGLRGVPSAGDTLTVVANEERARKLSELRSDVSRDARHEVQFVARQSAESRLAAKKAALEAELEGMSEDDEEEIQKKKAMLKVEDDGPCELVVVVKADVDGTSEAVQAALKRLGSELVGVKVVFAGVGAVTHSDVALAEASGGVICAFNVAVPAAMEVMAREKSVRTMSHKVIYHMLDEVGELLKETAPMRNVEEVVGHADIVQVFDVKARKNSAIIAGCRVKDGRMILANKMRILRGEEDTVVHEGKCASIRRHRQEVEVVGRNTECGIQLEGYSEFKPGDRIECFHIVERPAHFEEVVGGGVRIIE